MTPDNLLALPDCIRGDGLDSKPVRQSKDSRSERVFRTNNTSSTFGVLIHTNTGSDQGSAGRKGPAHIQKLTNNLSQALHKGEGSHTCLVAGIVCTAAQRQGNIRRKDLTKKGYNRIGGQNCSMRPRIRVRRTRCNKSGDRQMRGWHCRNQGRHIYPRQSGNARCGIHRL